MKEHGAERTDLAEAPQRTARRSGRQAQRSGGQPQLLALQQLAGNRATAAAVGGAGPITIQRHFQSPLHVDHTGAHSDAAAEQAATLLQALLKEATELDEQVKGPRTTASTAQSAMKRLAELATQAESQSKVILGASNATQKPARGQAARQARDKISGARDRTSRTEEELARTDAKARVDYAAPNLLQRIEAQATTGAEALSTAIATRPAAAAAKKSAEAAEVQAKVLLDRFDELDQVAARFPGVRLRLAAYRAAADKATAMATEMATQASELEQAYRHALAKQSEADIHQSLLVDLEAAEKAEAEATAEVLYLQGFAQAFNEDLNAIVDDPEANPAAIAEMRLMAADKVAAAQLDQTNAHAKVLLAQAVLAGKPATTQTEASGAMLAATGKGAAVAVTATSASSTLTGDQELRDLAGGAPALAEFQLKVPDTAKLTDLLKALGRDQLDRWLDNGSIGAAKLLALLTAFGRDGLKTFVTEVSGPGATKLVSHFTADVNHQLHTDLGGTRLKNLSAEFTAETIETFVARLTTEQIKSLVDLVTAAVLRRTTLTAVQLADLLTKFDAATLKSMVDDLGDGALADLKTQFTADELFTYRADVGGQARLKVLMVTRKLKADALKHYPAARLRTFVGCGAGAIAHLTVIAFNGVGAVSGGHDQAVFNNFLAATYPGTAQPKGRVRGTIATRGTLTKVSYDTFRLNGTVWNSGSKTLIPDLVAQPGAWTARFNEAIWESIRSKRFVFDAGAFTGVTAAGLGCAGFHNGGDEVDTVYPDI